MSSKMCVCVQRGSPALCRRSEGEFWLGVPLPCFVLFSNLYIYCGAWTQDPELKSHVLFRLSQPAPPPLRSVVDPWPCPHRAPSREVLFGSLNPEGLTWFYALSPVVFVHFINVLPWSSRLCFVLAVCVYVYVCVWVGADVFRRQEFLLWFITHHLED